jgi:hypothetical protein
MTDFTLVAPVSVRRPAFSSWRLPKLNLGWAVARTLEAFRHALDLAYVQPYWPSRPSQSQPQLVLDGSEKGRNSSW